ncbi:MAG: DUF4422 domain-containing protein [Clostridiales bacterium]|nr:DUF4422 domain-containing protein [Clostridiales bacterium]
MITKTDNYNNRIDSNDPSCKPAVLTYISTYGHRCMKPGKGIPLEVGAEGRNNYIFPLHDNTGDHISYENEYYGDLTALYWIWKNGEKEKYEAIEFRHYNKYLIISENETSEFLHLNKNGWIVAKAAPNPPHNYVEEWKCFRELVKEKYHVYYNALLKLYDEADGSGYQCNSTNMFITSTDQLNKYCSVLFEICKDLRERIGNTVHSRSDQRYCAFMAERFLSVYLCTHSLPRLETEVCRENKFLSRVRKAAKLIGVRYRYKSSYNNY